MAIAENQITLEIVSDGQGGGGVSVDTDYNIDSVQEEYAIGTVSGATGEWSTEVPELTQANPKLWYRQKVTYLNETVSYNPSENGVIKKEVSETGLLSKKETATAQEQADNAVAELDNKVDATTYDEDMAVRDTQINDIDVDIGEINEQLLKELVAQGYAQITNEPSLILGRNNSPWKVVLTNNAILLQKNSSYVASLAQDIGRPTETTLKADNARLANLRLRSADNKGVLGIVAQSNGHVSLKEI